MTKALIIGAGVAGPVAGIALRRAGLEVSLAEASPTGADEAGAFLTLQSNGMDALRTLGIQDVVAGLGFPTPSIRLFSGTGKLLGEVPNGGTLPDGTVSSTLRRADLYRALRDEAARQSIPITFGRRFVEAERIVTPAGEQVEARFDDGSTERADVLIGADGIRSKVRTHIDAEAPPARYVPLLNIGGVARGVSTSARPGEYCMVFGKRAFFGWTVAPGGETWWFANPPRRDEPAPGELAAVTDRQWRERLSALFADDASPAAELIQASEAPLRGWTTYDVPKVPHWHDGSAVVIGDAAHATSPSSGQGASMAIEDAVVLALCLRDVGSVPAALQRFTTLRRARVERVVRVGARTSSTKTAGPVGRVLRDLMMPAVLKLVAGRGAASSAWMHEYHLEWDAPVGTGI